MLEQALPTRGSQCGCGEASGDASMGREEKGCGWSQTMKGCECEAQGLGREEVCI